ALPASRSAGRERKRLEGPWAHGKISCVVGTDIGDAQKGAAVCAKAEHFGAKRMKVVFAFFAEYAQQITDGRLNILGLNLKTFPAAGTYVFRISVDGEELRKLPMSVQHVGEPSAVVP